MPTYYAWSVFHAERNEWGQPTKTINCGETVSKSDLDVSDADWDYLVETGAVREQPYPDIPDNVSPREHFLDLLQRMQSGELKSDDLKEFKKLEDAGLANTETALTAGAVPAGVESGTSSKASDTSKKS